MRQIRGAKTTASSRTTLAERPDRLLSVGRPLPGTEVRVVDVDDITVAHGAVGEIVVRVRS